MDFVFVVCEEWALKEERSSDILVFDNLTSAMKYKEQRIKEFKNEDELYTDVDNVPCEEETNDSFLAFEDNNYNENHWSITVKKEMVRN